MTPTARRSPSRRAMLGAAASVTVAALTGCSLGAATGPTTASGGSTTAVRKIGLLVQDTTNPYFAVMQREVEARAQILGATLATQDGQLDLGRQSDQIDAFIEQGVDIILISAVDSRGIGPAVTRARTAGITVVALDVAAQGAQATVSSDNVLAGRQACGYLGDKIGGHGTILVIDGPPVSSVQDRLAGCRDTLSRTYPHISIAAVVPSDGSRGKAVNLTTDLLAQHQDVAGIFAFNDPSALGATTAANQAGRKDLVIVGVDGSPEAITELKVAGSMFKATSTQDPRAIARTALDLAVTARAGGTLPTSVVTVPVTLVDSSNVQGYQGWQ